MYRFKVSDKTIGNLLNASKVATSIPTKLNELTANPMSISIETKIQAIGDYYINTGRFCIVFNIDEPSKTIELLSIVQGPYLHKVITGRISA